MVHLEQMLRTSRLPLEKVVPLFAALLSLSLPSRYPPLTLTLLTEHASRQYFAAGTVLQGWFVAEQRHGAEGIAQMQRGLAAYRATGTEMYRP